MLYCTVIPGRERSERTRNPYSLTEVMDSGPTPSACPGMTKEERL